MGFPTARRPMLISIQVEWGQKHTRIFKLATPKLGINFENTMWVCGIIDSSFFIRCCENVAEFTHKNICYSNRVTAKDRKVIESSSHPVRKN